MLDLLEELTALPGPSGYERAVARRMLAGMRELGVEVEMDRMGNVIGYVPGRSHDRKLMLDAHTDEVGLMVKCITDDGLIYFDQNGVISAMCLPSAKVQIVTRERLYTGVIGTKKYVYDVWGDTVNTASRMESSGVPGEIQVSEDTYQLLSDRYQFEERGLIAVKGKGGIKAFLLKGRAV